MGTCSACHKRVRPVRPSPLWWLVLAVAAPTVLLSFMVLAVMQPIAIVAAPIYFWVLVFPVSALIQKLTADPMCPECDKVFVEDEVARAQDRAREARKASAERRLVTSPSH